jgi:hypothetical protein
MRNSRSQNPSMIAVSLSLMAAVLMALPALADPNDHAWRMSRPVNYEVIESGNDGVYLEPMTLVVTSERDWNNSMERLADDGLIFVLPPPEPPAGVDWDNEAVLLVTLGQLTELHCYLVVNEVRRISFRALCDARVDVLPGPHIQTITSPYFIVKFDRRGGHLRSAAARFEYNYLGQGNSKLDIQYSDREAFTVIDEVEPPLNVSWGELKSLLSKF